MKTHFLVAPVLLAVILASALLPTSVDAQVPQYLTQWGTIGSGDGQLYKLHDIAIDDSNNAYVADMGNGRIEVFTTGGTYLRQWGPFSHPYGVAVDGTGSVYVANSFADEIQVFSSTGAFLRQWSTASEPAGMAIDENGNVYVATVAGNLIQKFTGGGTLLCQWGSTGSGDGQFINPWDVALNGRGEVYVVDAVNCRVQVFTTSGTYLRQWGTPGTGDGQFNIPEGVLCDRSGNVYVSDTYNHRIQMFTGNGVYLAQWGGPGSGDGQFKYQVGMALDASGNIYVADHDNNRVQVFGPTFGLQVAFEFMPQTLNLRSNGRWVTGYLRPPAPYRASQIDVSSIRLNGAVAVSSEHQPVIEDGDTQLTVKFLREEVQRTLTPGDRVSVVVTGTIAGQQFTGSDSITVIAPRARALLADVVVAPGSMASVSWEAPGRTVAGSAALLLSLDDGLTWTVEAEGLPATGSYAWTAPSTTTEQAQLVIGVLHGTDGTGPVLESEFAASDPFSLVAPTGVGDGRAAFALRPTNPATGPVAVSYCLPSGAPATLAAFDIGGRCVAVREVGTDGPGWHTTRLGDLPAGLYLVRLSQAGRSLTSRVAVVR